MNRRAFLKVIGSAALLPVLLRRSWASTSVRRVRPTDAAWPSESAWKQLNDAVDGNLIAVDFPLSVLRTDPASAAARQLAKNLRNPYYIGDTPGLPRRWDGWTRGPPSQACTLSPQETPGTSPRASISRARTTCAWSSRAAATATRERPTRRTRC